MVVAERKRGKFKSGGEEIGARHANPTQIPLVVVVVVVVVVFLFFLFFFHLSASVYYRASCYSSFYSLNS